MIPTRSNQSPIPGIIEDSEGRRQGLGTCCHGGSSYPIRTR